MRISNVALDQPVFNLAVEDDETYVAEGVVVHNCRSMLVYVTIDDAPIDWSTDKEIDAAVQLIQAGFK